ncbi:MAG: Na+/H+ antiporter NhaC family protein [Oscillospiraceae bacterium]|nr:Na+/H+ antiporter NhaC family protein [Oscillospiraceae bacterium]
MKRTFTRILLLILALTLLGGLAVSVSASDYTDPDAALDYLDSYADNVGTDESFADNIAQALATVRQSISSYATFWSLLPPIIAIALALITKEVYASLFVGILSGALIYTNFNPWGMVTNTFDVMIAKLSDSWNVGILIFLVALGMMVCLINKAGGSAAYGRWASKHIKSRTGAILSTAVLGLLIFVDDYFNCLTVGSVMRPVTDKHNVSRAKLSYIIDATAAPVCIIAPISSWAAAVSSVAPEGQGLTLFIRSIPYNLYALLTIAMVVLLAVMKLDFSKMRVHELNAMKGDLYTTDARPYAGAEEAADNGKGHVIDLILPIVVLIVSCVLCMVYTGGFFEGAGFIEAFSNSDASVGLVLGSVIALAFTALLYLPRKVISFKEYSAALTDGFKAMVPAMMILTFAWTLSGVTNQLGAKVFVAEFVRVSAGGLANFLPAIVFAIGVGLAFATGTSWGTFGVLLPIVCSVFPSGELMIIAVSACLAGAVCGDHCSPISDTTIMASTGGQCDHINHVSTQLPYALLVAAVSFAGYILAGFVQSAWIVLPVSLAVLVAVLVTIKLVQAKKGSETASQKG